VLASLSFPADERVLVGLETSADAGVFRISADTALVQTVDFLTPVVDDPFVFGQIAVCNGLSDIYAMGGVPITALNLICFPTNKFSLDILSKILEGGLAVLERAGVRLLGGHSVEDEELKFGIAVTGVVHPDRVIRNCDIRTGDALVLTKPLGTGIISTAVKAAIADSSTLLPYIESMTMLNDRAAEIMRQYSVHACTDITGFGLAGHLSEMLQKKNMEIAIRAENLPILPRTLDLARMGIIPAGMYRNREYVGTLCAVNPALPQELSDIAFDPQTSGGLVMALPESEAVSLVERLHESGMKHASIIAVVRESAGPLIRMD